MHARQGETGVLQVVKVHSEPVIQVVALLAGGGEAGGNVARAGRALEVAAVARVALRRQPLKLADGRALVAGVTLQGSVCADQRKAILVLLDLLDGNLPALHGMALLAVCPKLTAVNVSVAVGTF